MTEAAIQRALAHAVRTPGGCLLYLSSLDGDGYAQFRQVIGGKRMRFKGHRVMYERANGPVPIGMILRHTCDNRPCVNPDHLIPGTTAENLGDTKVRGRVRNMHTVHTLGRAEQPWLALGLGPKRRGGA